MINTKLIPVVSGIYKFTNKINNKCYIGQAKNLKVRIQGHLRDYKTNKTNNHLYSSIQKYEVENFELEILVYGIFSKNELNDLEIDFIRLYNSNNSIYGYNMTTGGEGQSGFKQSSETKEKRGLKLKGKKRSEEIKQKMRNRKHTEETRKKMSESRKGKKHTEKAKQNIRDGLKNKKPMSEETKEKIRTFSLNRRHSEESKQKIGLKSKSRKHTQKTKDKIGQANLGKKHSQESIEKRTRTKKFNKIVKYFEKNNLTYEWVI